MNYLYSLKLRRLFDFNCFLPLPQVRIQMSCCSKESYSENARCRKFEVIIIATHITGKGVSIQNIHMEHFTLSPNLHVLVRNLLVVMKIKPFQATTMASSRHKSERDFHDLLLLQSFCGLALRRITEAYLPFRRENLAFFDRPS